MAIPDSDIQTRQSDTTATESKALPEVQNKSSCKGCSADVHVSEKQIQRILTALNAHPDQCVSDEIYEQRMAACTTCPSLAYGTTCMHCGCFVAVRAKFIEKGCPQPGHPFW